MCNVREWMWRYIKTTHILSRTNNIDNVIAFKYRSILLSWNLALRVILFIVLIRRVAIFIDHIIIRRRVWPRKRDRLRGGNAKLFGTFPVFRPSCFPR